VIMSEIRSVMWDINVGTRRTNFDQAEGPPRLASQGPDEHDATPTSDEAAHPAPVCLGSVQLLCFKPPF
jgi:hypothetical protein